MRKIALTVSMILTVAVFCLLIAKDSSAIFTTTGTLNISATVPSGCAVTTTPVSFGAYLSGQPGQALANGNISVNCPNATNYQIALNPGQYYNAVDRRMYNGNPAMFPMDYLTYILFWDNTYTTGAGDGFTLGSQNSGIGNLTWQNYTVYGVIYGGQTVNPGNYTDSVTVTISW